MNDFLLMISVGIIFIGCFMVALSRPINGVKKAYRLYGLFFIISGFLLAVGMRPSKDAPDGNALFSVMGFIGVVITCVLVKLEMDKTKDENKMKKAEEAKDIGGTPLNCFFVECVLSGVNDFSQVKNVEKAKLLADKYKLSYPNGIEHLYKEGLEEYRIVNKYLTERELKKLRESEIEEYEEFNKYSDLIGKDKRIKMLKDQAEKLEKEAKSLDEVSHMLYRSGQKSEKNWAMYGGIAEGLGGIGVGIAAAADVQMQNMEIRAENERRRQEMLPFSSAYSSSASDCRRRAEKILEEIAKFKNKLMSNEPIERLMTHLTFEKTGVTISKTGAAIVSTTATFDSDFKIFNDVPAVVDGTLIANVYDGDQLCGSTHLVLPTNGLGKNILLKGTCFNHFDPNKTYTVKIEPKHLWALEK